MVVRSLNLHKYLARPISEKIVSFITDLRHDLQVDVIKKV